MATDNRKLMLPFDVNTYLAGSGLTFDEVRLLIGLFHAQDLADGWDRARVVENYHRTFYAGTADIRDRVGPTGATDNRTLLNTLPRLRQINVFRELKLDPRGKFIVWGVTEQILDSMAHRSLGYVLLDLNIVREMRSVAQLQLYLTVQAHLRKHHPMLEIPIPLYDWKVSRAKHIRILRHLADRLGVTFHVASCYRPDRPELGRLVIKIVTSETRWKSAALRKFPPNAGVSIIRPAPADPAPLGRLVDKDGLGRCATRSLSTVDQ